MKLPKIAIEYSKENWKEVKKAVDYLRSQGVEVLRRKDEDIGEWTSHLECSGNRKCFEYVNWADRFSTILSIPRDFDKLKSYFNEEPKDGEVWVRLGCESELWVNRIKNIKGDLVRTHTSTTPFDNYVDFNSTSSLSSYKRKATPEETSKLIEAEHANGYHWNSDKKELVKIPEYVKRNGVTCMVSDYNKEDGLWEVIGFTTLVNTVDLLKMASTKEAFEAQNKPKAVKVAQHIIDKQFYNKVAKIQEAFKGLGIAGCATNGNEIIMPQYNTVSDAITAKLNKDMERENKALKEQLDTSLSNQCSGLGYSLAEYTNEFGKMNAPHIIKRDKEIKDLKAKIKELEEDNKDVKALIKTSAYKSQAKQHSEMYHLMANLYNSNVDDLLKNVNAIKEYFDKTFPF